MADLFQIDFDKIKNHVFTVNSEKILNRAPAAYTDTDVLPYVSPDTFQSGIFTALYNFWYVLTGVDEVKVDLDDNYGLENNMCHRRYYASKGFRLEVFTLKSANPVSEYDYSFAIVFGRMRPHDSFLLLCNKSSHPEVMCNAFSFFNSDGSTEPTIPFQKFVDLEFEDLKQFIKETAEDYTLNQGH